MTEVFLDLCDTIEKFNNKYFPNWFNINPIYYTNALAGEVGELCNLTKKLIGGGTKGNKINNSELIEEMADILIYLILTMGNLGFTPMDLINETYNKNKINIKRMEKRNIKKGKVCNKYS